jgi:hypothetical protein
MKKILVVIVILAILSGAYGLYTYFKPAANIAKAKSELTISADELMDAFSANATAANQTYTGRVISVKGNVKAMENSTSISFSTGKDYIISFQFNDSLTTNYSPGTSLTIKGLYNGFLEPDAMFEMPGNIQISQCSIEN